MTDPAASSTARLTKFSEAISSRPLFWRWSSSRIAPAISGSVSARVRHKGSWVFVSVAISTFSPGAMRARSRTGTLLGLPAFFRLADLIDPALVASARERRLQPDLEDLVRQTRPDDASAHREDVGVVVFARQAGGIEV